MKRFFFLLFFSISVYAYASPAEVIRIWKGIPGMDRMKSELYVYPAPDSINTHLAVVICPGGSYYHMLGIRKEGFEVAEWLRDKGINAFVLRYRVGSGGYHHPAMIQDMQRALQIVRENAASYGILQDGTGALGFSAGGHLALMAAVFNSSDYLAPLGIMTDCKLSPDFVGAIYPVVSMQDSLAHKRSRRNFLTWPFSKNKKNAFSLELHIPCNMPPTFLCACKDDPEVRYGNSVELDKALTKKGVPHEFISYDSGGHGFGIRENLAPDASKWKYEFINWINSIYFAK